jgi:hypothetical protein
VFGKLKQCDFYFFRPDFDLCLVLLSDHDSPGMVSLRWGALPLGAAVWPSQKHQHFCRRVSEIANTKAAFAWREILKKYGGSVVGKSTINEELSIATFLITRGQTQLYSFGLYPHQTPQIRWWYPCLWMNSP